MFGVVGTKPMQLLHQLRRDALGLGKIHPAMNDAVAYAQEAGATEVLFEPADEKFTRSAVIRSGDGELVGGFGAVFDRDSGAGQADAFDLAGEQARARRIEGEKREFDAGGAAVDGKDAASAGIRSLGDGGCGL